jgi:uncharacterized protein (DUF362 family)
MNDKKCCAHSVSDRRTFLRNAVLGSAGLTLGSMAHSDSSVSGATPGGSKSTPAAGVRMRRTTHSGPSNVSLYSSSNQREAAFKALKPLQGEIEKAIGSKQVLVKVNMTQTAPNVWLCATDANFTRGILDFLKLFYDRQVIVAESSASRSGTRDGFNNYGYLPLEKEYKVKLVDLNEMPTTQVWIQDGLYNPSPISIINTFLDPEIYMISATRFKTHDKVIATLSFKNIAMGAPIRSENSSKGLMHRGPKLGKDVSHNMFRLATYGVQPDLAVLDGIVGMEGDGPNRGTPKGGKIVLASTDWVAADRIGVELMGVDYKQTKYLQFCSAAGMGVDDISKMNLIGEDYHKHISAFVLHKNVDQQREWLHEDYKI